MPLTPMASHRSTPASQAGMTLIELLIAITVLALGLAGIMAMVSTAISNNTRNRHDTTATMLAQTVLQQILVQPADRTASIAVTDCNPAGATTWTVATAGAASPGAGAAVDTTTGAIDFTQAGADVPSGYKLMYVACGSNPASYEVRWNVLTTSAHTRLVTVGARQRGGSSGTVTFAPPVTLRSIGGM